jgi:hypothetical protein
MFNISNNVTLRQLLITASKDRTLKEDIETLIAETVFLEPVRFELAQSQPRVKSL